MKMPITEEQRQRAEANRLAALAKRKAFTESITNRPQQQDQNNPWRLFKCRKLTPELTSTTIFPNSNAHLEQKFLVRLEICSPDSFSVTPEALQGFAYPGEEECLRRLNCCLSDVSQAFLQFLVFFLWPLRKWQKMRGHGEWVGAVVFCFFSLNFVFLKNDNCGNGKKKSFGNGLIQAL